MENLDNRSTMLILERNLDLSQPLMHGTCLQSFVRDYLPEDQLQPPPPCMSSTDNLWPRFNREP